MILRAVYVASDAQVANQEQQLLSHKGVKDETARLEKELAEALSNAKSAEERAMSARVEAEQIRNEEKDRRSKFLMVQKKFNAEKSLLEQQLKALEAKCATLQGSTETAEALAREVGHIAATKASSRESAPTLS